MNEGKVTTSLADVVYEQVEQDILTGVYKRGDVLTELKLELLTKSLVRGARRENRKKKDAYRRHPIHLIILFKFKAVAERRQWSSAASNPRRKTRVKLCPHF